MKKLDYRFLECVKKMPPLHHTLPGQAFDIQKSEVAAWIVSQPKVIQKVFDMANNNGAIQYDPETGTWQGVDYNED